MSTTTTATTSTGQTSKTITATGSAPSSSVDSALSPWLDSQKPDFILDMQPNLDKKPLRGRWCIRRFDEVEAEWKKTNTKDLEFGIISYAWGPWHDKSKYALGSVVNDPGLSKYDEPGQVQGTNPRIASVPGYEYPTFDIGFSKQPSDTGPELKATAPYFSKSQTVSSQGSTSQTTSAQAAPAQAAPAQAAPAQAPPSQAAPSQATSSQATSGQAPSGQTASTTGASITKPPFPTGIPLTWVFPILRSRDDKGNDKSAPFDVDQVYTALKALEIRYVWWDWACLPQGWDDDPWTGTKSTAPEFRAHNDLKDVKARTTNNMRYFYPRSTVGCLWWHQSIWDPLIQPSYLAGKKGDPTYLVPVAELEEKKPLQSQDGIGNRDYNSIQWVINGILSMCDWSAIDDKSAQNLDTLVGNATQGAVVQFIQNLVAARFHETSLRSLWSFQEGVLFTSSRRPLRSLEQAQQAGQTQKPSVILDRYGREFKLPNTPTKIFSGVFPSGNVNLIDICRVATLVAAALADGLISRAYAPHEKRYWQDKAAAAVPNYLVRFSDWCSNKVNDGAARLLLSRLLNTGLVGYTYDSPLTLLEGKFGRIWETWQSDMDVYINTIMGTLEVDFAAELKIAAGLAQAIRDSGTDEGGKSARNERAKQDEINNARPRFLVKLFDLYQWRLLLLARGDDFQGLLESSYKGPFWDQLISKDRAPFAPLSVYLPSRDKELAYHFGPNKGNNNILDAPPVALPEGLPKLSIPDDRVPYLRIGAEPKYTMYEFLDNFAGTGWTDAFCYHYVKPGHILGEIAPGATVETIALSFKDRHQLAPSAGNFCLLPIRDFVVGGITKKSTIDSEGAGWKMTPALYKETQLMGPTSAPPVVPPAVPPTPVVTGAEVLAKIKALSAKIDKLATLDAKKLASLGYSAKPTGASDTWTMCAILIKYQKAPPAKCPPDLDAPPTRAVFWGIGDFKGLSGSGGAANLHKDIFVY